MEGTSARRPGTDPGATGEMTEATREPGRDGDTVSKQAVPRRQPHRHPRPVGQARRAMLVAPLMIPIQGTMLASVLGDRANLVRSIGVVVTAAVAVIGYVLAALVPNDVVAANNSQVARPARSLPARPVRIRR
jgi:hypothetical protein